MSPRPSHRVLARILAVIVYLIGTLAILAKLGWEAMRLLIYPSNQDVFWVVLGWTVLYGVIRTLLTDGTNESFQTFDDSQWPLAILFGWPVLYWLVSHGLLAG
jgi:hypothetical protein